MTRDERAARRAQRLKEDIATKGQELAQVEAQQRADARAKRDRRRQRVGTPADAAGLLVWDDTTLTGLFQILATLRETPDPVAVLESLLADMTPSALTPAAAGPCCLTSSAASDASDVSQGTTGQRIGAHRCSAGELSARNLSRSDGLRSGYPASRRSSR